MFLFVPPPSFSRPKSMDVNMHLSCVFGLLVFTGVSINCSVLTSLM